MTNTDYYFKKESLRHVVVPRKFNSLLRLDHCSFLNFEIDKTINYNYFGNFLTSYFLENQNTLKIFTNFLFILYEFVSFSLKARYFSLNCTAGCEEGNLDTIALNWLVALSGHSLSCYFGYLTSIRQKLFEPDCQIYLWISAVLCQTMWTILYIQITNSTGYLSFLHVGSLPQVVVWCG